MRVWNYSLSREVKFHDDGISESDVFHYNNLDESLQKGGETHLIEEEIAKRFAELLKKHNLTTYKYTQQSSISKNSVYNVSQGKNVRIDTLNQICEDLGINLHKFFEYQDKDSLTLSEDEKRLIDDYRRLEYEQEIRVKAYLDGLLALQQSKKN